MSIEFVPEMLSAKRVVSPDGVYRMIEVDGFWSVFYEGRTVHLIGTAMREVEAMKLIDVHMRTTHEKNEELKKNCNCGTSCDNSKCCQ